jgi:hypothetical protein
LNLTGYTFEMGLKKEGSLATYDFSEYFTIPTPANGTAVLTVPSAVTATVADEIGRAHV